MRRVLGGEKLIDETLAFLPALIAAWFISEPSRNELTTLTSLLLLDLIESDSFLDCGNGANWYTWSHTLIHPFKASGARDVADLYGKKCDGIDYFGGCHLMVNRGSVNQTQKLPLYKDPLTFSRQKEGHLLIHWLEKKLTEQSMKIKCVRSEGAYAAPLDMQDFQTRIDFVKKKN